MNSPNPYMQPAPVVMPNPIFSPTGIAQGQPMPQMNSPQQGPVQPQVLNQISPEVLGSALQKYSANDQNMPSSQGDLGAAAIDAVGKMFTKDREHKDNIFDRIDQASKIYDDYQSGGMDKALGGMLGPKSYANVKPLTDKIISSGNAIGNYAGSAYKGLKGLF